MEMVRRGECGEAGKEWGLWERGLQRGAPGEAACERARHELPRPPRASSASRDRFRRPGSAGGMEAPGAVHPRPTQPRSSIRKRYVLPAVRMSSIRGPGAGREAVGAGGEGGKRSLRGRAGRGGVGHARREPEAAEVTGSGEKQWGRRAGQLPDSREGEHSGEKGAPCGKGGSRSGGRVDAGTAGWRVRGGARAGGFKVHKRATMRAHVCAGGVSERGLVRGAFRLSAA